MEENMWLNFFLTEMVLFSASSEPAFETALEIYMVPSVVNDPKALAKQELLQSLNCSLASMKEDGNWQEKVIIYTTLKVQQYLGLAKACMPRFFYYHGNRLHSTKHANNNNNKILHQAKHAGKAFTSTQANPSPTFKNNMWRYVYLWSLSCKCLSWDGDFRELGDNLTHSCICHRPPFILWYTAQIQHLEK